MSENSAIEWCDATWNPVLGCAKVSEGCRGCYAIPQAWMKQSNPSATVREAYSGLVEKRPDGSLNWTGRVNLVPERLPLPLTWKRPKRIFVNSLSDLFHESVPDEFIDRVFATMAITDHTFLVLTKRPHRMFSYLTNSLRESAVIEAMDDDYDAVPAGQWTWPLPNVWVGTSTEDQRTADERIPHLLRVPAAVRFLSCEPLLGPINLHPWMGHWAGVDVVEGAPIAVGARLIPNPIRVPKIHWVICGGESGPKARPMHPDWARSLRDQCISAGVAFQASRRAHAEGRRSAARRARVESGARWQERDRRGVEVNAPIARGVQAAEFGVQGMPSRLLFVRETVTHESPGVLLPQQINEGQCDLGLTALQAEVREQGTERGFRFGVLGVPDVPALVSGVLRLVSAVPTGERLVEQFGDDRRCLGQTDLDDVVERRRAVSLSAGARPLADADEPVCVDGAGQVSVERFHATHYTPLQQWGEWAPTVVTFGGDLGGDLRRGHTRHLHGPGNPEGHFRKGDAYVSRVGKHNAGRELDGRTWDQFPSAAVPS